MYSEKSSLAVRGGVAVNLSPNAAFRTFSAVAIIAASLTTALGPSAILMSGAGAFAMAATALAVRSIPLCILARTSGLKQQDRLVGNDVPGGAGMERSDGDHAEFGRVLFTADDALHFDHKTRRHHHGIDGRLWYRTMAAAAFEFDVEAVGIGRADPDPVVDVTVGKRPVMQGKAGIGLGKAREQAIGQHGFRTCTHF